MIQLDKIYLKKNFEPVNNNARNTKKMAKKTKKVLKMLKLNNKNFFFLKRLSATAFNL